MPILAQLVDDGGGPAAVALDDRRLEFRSIDGLDLIQWTGDEWIIQSGIQGLSVPPRDVITEAIPGMDGARLREVRTTVRTVVIPFFVLSADGDYRTHREQLAAIRRHLNYRDRDYAASDGTFDLVAVADGGERTLRVVYSDGMEGNAGVGSGEGPYWSTFDAKLLAVDPYWHGDEWTTPTVGTGSVTPFVSDTEPWPRAITGSVALGEDMSVTVGGDVPSPPSIELVGPFDSAVITSPQGLDVRIGAVPAGRLLVETGRHRRVTLDGVPAWDLVGDAPRWRALPPGTASISIVALGATADTSARVFGPSLWETAW